ncbi:MAG: thiamine phosphate synthase [Sediminibacterium sp.]
MDVVIITPEQNAPREIELVNHFLEKGARRIYLRKPSFELDDYRNYLNQIATHYHSFISLPDHFELLTTYGPMGIHLKSDPAGKKNFNSNSLPVKPSAISASFHSWEEIEEDLFPFDYVFISPVFDSISKKGYKAGIDIAGAARIKKIRKDRGVHCPAIIALGGVTAATIPLLQEQGFDGIAVLGSLWESPDPVMAFREIMQAARRPGDA